MKKKSANPQAIVNRRARFDYELSEDLVVGIVLTGPETRAARNGHVQLRGSYVSIQNGELWLTSAGFSIKLQEKGQSESRAIDTRPRKLLAHRKQIEQLESSKKSGMTIVPTKLLTTGHHIKLVIALGRGKKNYDKRNALKKRTADLDARRDLKSR